MKKKQKTAASCKSWKEIWRHLQVSGHLSANLKFLREWVLHGLTAGKLVLRAIPPAKAKHQANRVPLRGRTLVARFWILSVVAARGQMGVEGCGARGKEGSSQKAKDLIYVKGL